MTQPGGKVESGLGRNPLLGAAVFVPPKGSTDRNDFLVPLRTIAPLLGSSAAVVIVALTR